MKTVKPRMWIILSALMLFLLGSLVSCEKKIDNMKCSDITDIILDEVAFPEMVALNEEQLPMHFDFSSGIIEDFSCYISQSAEKTDEVAVFHLTSSEKSNEALIAISQHLSNKSNSFKDAVLEYDKIQTAVIRQSGNCIILVICDQNAAVAEKLDSLGATVI